MFLLNKLIGAIISPIGIAFALLVAAFVLLLLGGARNWARKWGITFLCFIFLWLWAWSSPFLTRLMGLSLEREYWAAEKGALPVPCVESFPECDAIVLLGGGMGFSTNASPYAEMWSGADRVWHAARLWKAKKAPIVIPSGQGCAWSDAQLLMDLGVPRESIKLEGSARNTEENARYSEQLVNQTVPAKVPAAPHKVLLVTSAWHMRRSVLMFERYAPGLEVVPCATDFESTIRFANRPLNSSEFFPDATSLWCNSMLFHEILGYWGYRLFR